MTDKSITEEGLCIKSDLTAAFQKRAKKFPERAEALMQIRRCFYDFSDSWK